MPIVTIGQRAYALGTAVASLAYSPLQDRASIVTRIFIDKPSAGDVWTVSVAGREVARFDIQTTGNQQPLSGPGSGYPKENDIFEIYQDLTGESLVYPVPQGCTITVASVGGATANIVIEYYECAPGECVPTMMNHPTGLRVVAPVVFYRAANVTAVGLQSFDTEIKPSWFPALFTGGSFAAGYNARILALFLEGAGVNTFSGAANHQSVSSYLQLIRNGQLMFTRQANGGLPNVGQASAAGSANTVYGADTSPYPAFQLSDPYDLQSPIFPLQYREGDNWNWQQQISGDVTGGAAYATMRHLAILDVRLVG